jgi:hypothetical protein
MPGPDFSGRWTFSPGASALQIRTPDAIEFLIDHREAVVPPGQNRWVFVKQ